MENVAYILCLQMAVAKTSDCQSATFVWPEVYILNNFCSFLFYLFLFLMFGPAFFQHFETNSLTTSQASYLQ